MFSFGKKDDNQNDSKNDRPDDKPLTNEPNQKQIDEDLAAQYRRDAADRKGGR